jgi:hypothetical protein
MVLFQKVFRKRSCMSWADNLTAGITGRRCKSLVRSIFPVGVGRGRDCYRLAYCATIHALMLVDGTRVRKCWAMNSTSKYTKVAHIASDEAQTAARMDSSQDLPRRTICDGHEADSRHRCSPHTVPLIVKSEALH